MKKHFCDICGATAMDIPNIYNRLETGEPFERSELGVLNIQKIRTKIVAKLSFSFEDHKTGYGGPPDLCGKCINTIINELKVVPIEQT